ncbi:hypothetical protein NA56DRAFT_704275 [Hyaloscypha hepaticicola]|uniref:DUF5672 domain-containing protein n=1 Tax=Hyaloscypha hepaticicola TaxID=2082293 RepID=A0A2J6Q442_9HELO|nr:hypothetical protein NA56DRAFT_704275 [Hyaloscypha hepaticicola]
MDSTLFSNAVWSVEDVFGYDLIAAPIVPAYERGYKGGLSLRKGAWMKEPVDQEEAAGIEGAINLPLMEIASTFSVETIDYPNPLGLK